MGIGLGIALLAIGAVLTFAVNVDVPYVTDDALGVILMGLGVLATILALVMNSQRANTSHTSLVEERRIEEH